MKDLGWIIAIGGGAYLLYYLYENGTFGGTPSTSTSSGGTSTTPQASNPNAALTSPTLTAVINAVSAAGVDPTSFQTVWTWNYYYQQVRGIPGPDPGTILPNNSNADTEKISISQWWSGMSSGGFSGLGTIANRVNPYLIGPRGDYAKGVAFGAGLAPTGMELYIKTPSGGQ